MEKLKLLSPKKSPTTSKKLKDGLEEMRKSYQNYMTHSNTEASLLWIIRGCIEYFDELDDEFLGEGNVSGIPDVKADHFANNIYRLNNSIDYLARLWKIKVEKSSNLKLLLDIRTLIVHSGEQITKIESLELEEYKDSQLGRIFSRKEHNSYCFFNEFSDMDYCIQVWGDKHDKARNYNLSQVDYHILNESYKDIDIYVKAKDVRDTVLCLVESFINCKKNSHDVKKVKVFPDIKNKVIDEKSGKIDFDKIADLISKDLRGGYFKENNIEYWDGFGLKRLYEYSQKRLDISNEVLEIINDQIYAVMSQYWDNYQDENIDINELPSLDIRSVFLKFTPDYKLKSYLEGEKLFNHIAPFFNTRDIKDATDINYLGEFIYEASNALGSRLNTKQSVDSLVCDYFVQSIQSKLNREGI